MLNLLGTPAGRALTGLTTLVLDDAMPRQRVAAFHPPKGLAHLGALGQLKVLGLRLQRLRPGTLRGLRAGLRGIQGLYTRVGLWTRVVVPAHKPCQRRRWRPSASAAVTLGWVITGVGRRKLERWA